MKNFRTTFNIPELKEKVSYSDKLLLTGSCFTENIGKSLSKFKFNVDINPFGIVYNPASIDKCLRYIVDNKVFKEDDLFFYNELWNSYSHHGSFSATESQECLKKINNRISIASNELKDCKYLIITFGTAWAYSLKKCSTIVSNCHKVPAKEFSRTMLTVERIVSTYIELIMMLRNYNPGLRLIFTVSPVRHWKEGAHGNQLSKSILLLAIDKLVNEFDFVDYFPAYEIVMDDLRDYRFYEEDMLHPNKAAVDYIWEKFKNSYIAKSDYGLMKEVSDIVNAASHRPYAENTEAFKKFVQAQLQKIQKIRRLNASLNLETEERYFRSKV